MSKPASADTLKAKEKVCRVLIQQCLNAQLKFDTDHPPVSIQKGIVVYVCFLQGASSSSIDQIARSILQARLSEADDDTPGRKSASELEKCDVLLIPQATLGGKLKGKNVQYHGIVSKPVGAELFSQLVDQVREILEGTSQGNVQAGIYGSRQILSMNTNGPYTHVFDF